MPNPEIINIATAWIDYALSKKLPTAKAWLLYDLACGRRPEVKPEVVAWVKSLDQRKPQVKKIVKWLDN